MRILHYLFLLLICQNSFAQFTQIAHGIELSGVPVGHTSGVSWYDFDHDGWDDLTVGQGNDAILVLRNVSGSLQLVYAFPNADQVKSFQWIDYDNDGDSDFFICAVNASCKLWRNEGAFVFTDVTANLNLPSAGEDSMGASWADYDRDGWVDVYVCNYFGTNWLLHNEGDGTFENVAPALGVTNSNRPTYMCTWLDYNNDCLLDLFVGNDLNQPCEMYENTGDGFEDVGFEIGLEITMEAMGICWSDYDNDLDLDVYITNIASGNKLFRNDNGIFTDVAAASGASVNALGWGCMWMDYNNDGLDDLHVCTQAPLVAQNVNFLLQQQIDTTFTNVSMSADAGNSFASAKGDFNNDGYWDFCDSFVLPALFKVWQNDGGENHWVKLDLNATIGNSDAIGSKIYYWHGGKQYYRHTFCGESFFGQDSQYEILSLGSSTAIDSLRVEWPDGRIDTYFNLASNQVYSLTEGSTSSSLSISASKTSLCSGSDEITLTVEGVDSYLWYDGNTNASTVVTEPGDYWVSVVSGCSVSDSLSITISQLPAPEVTVSATPPLCAGDNNGCMGVLLNGQQPVETIWAALSILDPCAAEAGTYSYEAIDENDCSVFGVIELIDPQPIVVTSAPVVSCGNETAAAMLSATGGTGSYSFSVMGADINELAPGEYVGIATDENACMGTVNFTVQAFPSVSFTASVDSICTGGVAGLEYFGGGGTLPYTYDWQGFNPNALPAGTYLFTLTDANGCVDEVSIEVAEYPELLATINSFTNANNGANGSITLTLSGGEAPYDILWNTGESSEILDSVGQGTYSVLVTDANGCTASAVQSIIDLNVHAMEDGRGIYPNPFTQAFTIESIVGSVYEVYDAHGRTIAFGKLISHREIVNTELWSTGVYRLSIEADGVKSTQTIVKQY